MSQLRILGATMLLLSTTLQAAESLPASFRIEMFIHNKTPCPTSVSVECLYGCAWDKQTIECPAETKECRAIIDGRFGVGPWSEALRGPEQPALPWSGSVCLGFNPGAPQGWEPGVAPVGVLIRRLDADSPAKLAGFQEGDVLTSFNATPVGPEELHDMIQSLEAGQVFEATLKRDGALIHVTGQLGIWTSVGKCLPATAELLAMPPAKQEPMTPFSLFIDNFGNTEIRCLEGCPWVRRMSLGACTPQGCSVTLTVHGEGEEVGQQENPTPR